MSRQFADRKPKAIGIPVPSGPQPRQVMEVCRRRRFWRSVRMMRHVSSCGPSMYMGIPSLPNSRSHTPSPLTEMPPRPFAKSACGSNPRPASVPDRAEHDPLGREPAASLRVLPDNCGRHQPQKRRELPPLYRLRPQGRSSHPGTRCRPGNSHTRTETAPLTGNDDDDQPRFPCLGCPRCPATPGGP